MRIEFPGAVYDVTGRGNERKTVLRDDEDGRRILAVLNRSWRVKAVGRAYLEARYTPREIADDRKVHYNTIRNLVRA